MTTLGTVIGIITTQYGYSASNASLFGAVFIVGGIIGSGVFGTIVEIKKNYKVVTCVICAITAISPIGLLFALKSLNVAATAIGCTVVGFASVSILPVGIDFGVELTHPVAESISSGLLMSSGQLFGIIFTVVSSLLITKKGDSGIIISELMMILFAFFASGVSFFI